MFFKLEGPVTPEELEAVNEAIRNRLGGNGDGVQNCDRLMRLAGTVSYPPPKKVAKGYVPELTRLISNPHPLAYKPAALIGLLKGTPDPKAGTGSLNGGSSVCGGGGADTTGGGDKKFWRQVNEMALGNLGLGCR